MAGTAATLSCSVRVFPSTALLTSTQTSTESSTSLISRLHLRAPQTRSVSQTLRSSQRSRKGVVRASLKGEGEKVQEFASKKAVEGVPQLTEYAKNLSLKNLSLGNAIEEVKKAIEKVEQDILDVERKLKESVTGADVAHLQEEKKQMREEKKQLREEKMLLLWAELSEQPSKEPNTAPKAIQLFAQSAAESYRKWERDYQLALSKVGEDPEEMRRPFLELKVDPLQNFTHGFLLWVRECYTDMKDILSVAQGRRFTILGTSGIGKSLFTIFWICYRATLKEKVVWKHGENRLYLLDFSTEPSAKEYDPLSLRHPDIQEVLEDENAWLVIDGRQADNQVYACKIIQACSMRKKNYKEYAKNQQVKLQYFPVWEEEEIRQFLDEFEQRRLNYEHMVVPLRDDALRYFEQIGGVARYVLCGSKTENRLREIRSAVGKLSGNTCLEYVAGNFQEDSDAIVHMKCQQRGDEKYSDYTYDFASSEVRCQFIQRFELAFKLDVVQFMTVYADSVKTGNTYGYAFELVAHALFVQGGQFPMKRVMQGGDPKGEEVGPLEVPTPVKVVFFQSLDKFPPFEADTYYWPRKNLESIDAILHPDYLLQYFSYNYGVHGYMVKGLQEVGAALGLSKCKVCSCVPIDKYDETGFQPWLNTKKVPYKAALPKMIKASEQYVIGVDYKNFS